MPPSPAMRCSPGREPRADNHKRVRSFESGLPLKQREDDLALFNEVQSRERDDFLLQSNDDFEDIFTSKLRYFSDNKLGINIPARGESSDLLHAEEEKNDYEWLLTPPDTPLFPSLDDEVPQVNPAQRGRTRTQPISISRSSTMEKSHRSSRGSASPNRASISPQSHNSPFESRGVRATSAPSASPPTPLKSATSSLKSSPPSRKPATPVPRASTPTSRRLSTGSNNSTAGSRGSRGNAPSPKVKAWQSTIPGFSTEVPPNLRTTLADRPPSYVRGSSPASRNSRQSMSPTASRSISSSHSKGSSADDDVDSFSSVVVSAGTQRLNSRRVGGMQNNNNNKRQHQQFLKKPSRTGSSSSAPTRSFDLALRQMDHRKDPQNMFRPLLTSVPGSSFHVGISNPPPNTMISRNSTVTTGSNASSGLMLGSVHEPKTGPDDATSGPLKVQERDVIEEVFVIEKEDDSLNESCDVDGKDLTPSLTFDSQTGLLVCSKCGCWFSPFGLETDTNLCGECLELDSPLTIVDPVTESGTTVDPQVEEVEVEVKPQSSQHDDLVKDSQSTYGEPIRNLSAQTSLPRSHSEECEIQQVNHDIVDFSKSKVDSLEGAGISLLLKRSNSMKGTVVRNMNFSASSISYDDFSYSVSVSSSVDFSGVNRLPETRLQRESSSAKSEIESYKFDLSNAKHNCSGPSSLSGTSSHAFNNEENDTFTPENNNGNETRVDSGESLLTDSLKAEEAVENYDTRALETCTLEDCTDVDKVQLDAISGEFDDAVMSVDGETSRVMRGVQHGACDYLLKPIRMKELRNIWQHVYRKKIHEVRDTESHEGLEEILMMRNVSEQQSDDGYMFCGGDMTTTGSKKRKDTEFKYEDKDFAEHSSVKKARVVWTVDLHQKFVKAVNLIGFEKVVPKKILDLMNVPWLTRENVASHLQKYRLYLTRLQRDDLKTSSSGLKHPDFSPTENRTEPIKPQQNEPVSSHLTPTNLIIQNPRSRLQEVDVKTIKPEKVITGYAAKPRAPTHPFESAQSTQYTPFNSLLPTQYSWGESFKEIQFKQELHNPPQFQLHPGFTNLGLPPQPHTIPSFQPPDPITGQTELPPFSVQSQPYVDHECNEQELLYDGLRFDYEYPGDSLEYPVIDQGLFIV